MADARAVLELVGTPTLVSTGTNRLILGTSGAGDLIFVTNGVERMRIASTGATTLSSSIDFTLANNDYLMARNAAGTASVGILKLDAGDDVVLNASTGNVVQLAINDAVQAIMYSAEFQINSTTGTFSTLGALRLRVDNSAARGFIFDAASDTALSLMFGEAGAAATASVIGTNSTDAADSNSICISAGSTQEAVGTTDRGGKLLIGGNEHATIPGETFLENNSVVRIRSATGAVQLRGLTTAIASASGSGGWTFTPASNSLLGNTATGTTYLIGTNSVDTTDSNILVLSGAATSSSTRSPSISLYGNEAAGGAGATAITGGGVATGNISLDLSHASAVVQVRDTGSNQLWAFSNGGALTSNATTGGDLVLAKASTSVRQVVGNTLTAAGTVFSDALALTAVVNNVTTVAAATGVRLWLAGVGSVVYVKNSGANALLVYPDTGGTINAAAANASVSIAVGAIGIFTVVAASTWVACEAAAA